MTNDDYLIERFGDDLRKFGENLNKEVELLVQEGNEGEKEGHTCENDSTIEEKKDELDGCVSAGNEVGISMRSIGKKTCTRKNWARADRGFIYEELRANLDSSIIHDDRKSDDSDDGYPFSHSYSDGEGESSKTVRYSKFNRQKRVMIIGSRSVYNSKTKMTR